MLSNVPLALVVFSSLCIGYMYGDVSVGECVICYSTKDANCAQKPQNIEPQKCKNQEDKCYTRIVDGTTFRGCLEELDQEIRNKCYSDSGNCLICENVHGIKGCNNNIFPSHRLTCHSCSGELKSDCTKVQNFNLLPCKIYKNDDQCYIRKTDKAIERGCLSETSNCNNASHCFICNGQGCNNEDGNSKNVPTAPSSAAWLTSTAFTLFIAVMVSLKPIS